jgi:hypothetical protein
VNFSDRTLVRLADPTTRAAVFDATALEQIAGTAYDAATMGIQGPFSAVFDSLSLGVGADRAGSVEGEWSELGSSSPTRASFRVNGLGDAGAPRIDAVWQGAVVARFSRSQERIDDVHTHWPPLEDVDAEIASDLGALPSDPAQLETERRARVIARMQSELDQVEAFDDEALTQWLAEIGAGSVGDVLGAGGAIQPGSVTVTFSPPAPVATTPRALPITGLLLVRDANVSVADLLAATGAVRDRARALGLERPVDPELRARRATVVIWVVPQSIFDDTDWPGANPAARRQRAGAWLAREGIGLAATT